MLNEALTAAVLDVERYVSAAGWDQPARLFALAPTAALVKAAPDLAAQLGAPDRAPGHLSSIEQEDFHGGRDLLAALAHLAWPQTVVGCILALERSFLPPAFEPAIPDDPDDAAQFVNDHPERQELRVVTGVLRDGARHSVARVKDRPDELLGGTDMAPGLAAALLDTFD